MDKKFNIIFDDNASDAEVIDSIADLFEVADMVEDTLEDGWQFQDLLVGLQAQPIVSEIAADIPVFTAQISKLPPARVKNAVFAARARAVQVRGQVGKITTMVGRGLLVLSSNYEYAISAFQGGQNQVLLYSALFAGAPMFPDELPGPETPEA